MKRGTKRAFNPRAERGGFHCEVAVRSLSAVPPPPGRHHRVGSQGIPHQYDAGQDRNLVEMAPLHTQQLSF